MNLFNKSQPIKKRRKSRTAFTNQQIYQLEKRFLYQKYLTPADRDELATGLDLSTAQVITWFQNRRAKLKRDLEELKADVTAAKSDDDQCELPAHAVTNEQELYEKHGLRRCERKDSAGYASSSSSGSTSGSLVFNRHPEDTIDIRPQSIDPSLHRRATQSVDDSLHRGSPDNKDIYQTT